MSAMAPIDPEALLCALILAPRTFPRNRFHSLFEDQALRKVRRRAARVRGILRQLLGTGKDQALIVGEQVAADGRVLLRYRVPALSFERTTALSALEAATLHYALSRVGQSELHGDERQKLEEVLGRLGRDLFAGLGQTPIDGLR
jgi:hypothetical protein